MADRLHTAKHGPRWQVLSRVSAALLGLVAGLTLLAAFWPSASRDEQVLGTAQHVIVPESRQSSSTTAVPRELVRAGHSTPASTNETDGQLQGHSGSVVDLGTDDVATGSETPDHQASGSAEDSAALLDPDAETEHDHSTHDHGGIESEEGGTHGDDHWTATLSNGTLVIDGLMPDEVSARQLVELSGEAVGPANVVEQYSIDPAAVDASHGHLRIDDALLFDFDSSRVDATDPLLEQAAALANISPTATLTIIGHTDRTGTADYNVRLSQERATAVAEQLVLRDIAPDRIRAVGRGEQEPVADSSTEEGRALNRRIEFTFENILGAG